MSKTLLQQKNEVKNIATPQKVQSSQQNKNRNNPSNSSTVFSEEKQSIEKRGKKQFLTPTKEVVIISKIQNKQNPLKKVDQPKESFYALDQEVKVKKYQMFTPRPSNQNDYRDKNSDQKIRLTPDQKKRSDQSSNIFHQKQINHSTLQTSRQRSPMVKWNHIHDDQSKTLVNENAIFDSDYSRIKKYQESISSALPSSEQNQIVSKILNLQPPPRVKYQDPNGQTKRVNQNFSDVFNNEYGSKDSQKKIRSLSPFLKWTQFDSVRDKIDYDSAEQQSWKKENNSKGKFSSQRLSERDIECRSTFKAIQGESCAFSDEKVKQKPLHEHNLYREITSNKVYTGIYSWKNHYQKQK